MPHHRTVFRDAQAVLWRIGFCLQHMRREEPRALLEQRRTVVARQLQRLAIELTDLNRQLEEIVQSERL